MTFTIQSIQFYPYCLTFKEPFKTAMGIISDREGFVIEIGDDQSCIGWGEAAPFAGFGMESLAETAIALNEAKRSLINAKINAKIEDLNDLENLLARYNHTPAAKHGLELALLNLLVHHLPIHHTERSLSHLLAAHFGNPVRDFVPVNAVIGAVSPNFAAIKAKEYLDQGFSCLKIKVGTDDFEADLQRILAVRSLVGDHGQIRIDANQGWSVQEAIANLKRLEFLQIEYVEQPVIAGDLLGMAEVRRSQAILIAADESVNNLTQLQQVIDTQAADIIILKPMALGGILTAYRAAMLSLQSGLDVVVTTTIDGAIAREAAFSLAAALPIKRACGLATGNLFIEPPPPIQL